MFAAATAGIFAFEWSECRGHERRDPQALAQRLDGEGDRLHPDRDHGHSDDAC